MDRVFYVSGTGGERVNLDGGGILVGTAKALRGRTWTYSLAARNVSSALRNAREVTVDAAFLDAATADRLRHLADRDMRKKTAGRIEIGNWFQRAYITACKPDTIFNGYHSAQLTVALLDGVWNKEITRVFSAWSQTAVFGGYDLPYDLDCDLGFKGYVEPIQTESYSECPIKLVIYGYAENPEVIIGGNTYAASVTVPAGGKLVIDGLTKTATLYTQEGAETDVFAKVSRGSGLGSGEYAFQPLPEGAADVSWDGTFSFDVIYYEQEGEPPWELS